MLFYATKVELAEFSINQKCTVYFKPIAFSALLFNQKL